MSDGDNSDDDEDDAAARAAVLNRDVERGFAWGCCVSRCSRTVRGLKGKVVQRC